MPYAETREKCEVLRNRFMERYEKDQPKACEILRNDWDRMVTFYLFPKAHWTHLRTTNVVESPFAAVRLRTNAAKRFRRVEHATAMIWKLLRVAEKRFRTLKGAERLEGVYEGKLYQDGEEITNTQPERIAA
jgi:transposase-like protein